MSKRVKHDAYSLKRQYIVLWGWIYIAISLISLSNFFVQRDFWWAFFLLGGLYVIFDKGSRSKFGIHFAILVGVSLSRSIYFVVYAAISETQIIRTYIGAALLYFGTSVSHYLISGTTDCVRRKIGSEHD